MADIKITYFNTTGRAEISRLILAYAGVKYTDERITSEEFAAIKGKLPWGQLPIITYNGTVLGQSMTQARFLANEYNLAGRNNLEKAQADEIVDTLMDLMGNIPAIMTCKDDEKKKELLAKLKEKATETFDRLTKRLESRGGQYFAGNALTWADIFFFTFNEQLYNFCPKHCDGYLLLKNLVERVGALPNIKHWVANRPQ